MIISDLELYLVEIPSHTTPKTRSLVVRLFSHAGQEGWGEATVSWRQDELQPRRNQILSILAGRNVFDLEELIHFEELQPKTVRFAIETACWDMIGRLCKHPVHHFHGGAYRHHLPIAARLSDGTPEDIAQSALEFAHLGYHCQTLPLTGNLETDLRRVELLTETVGTRLELRVDMAGKYDYETCVSLLSRWEKTNLAMVIDPLNEEHCFRGVSALQEQTEIPLVPRRGIQSAGDVLEIARCGNIHRLVLDPQSFGSILAVKKSAAIAEAAGIRLSLCVSGAAGPFLATVLQLSASLPAISLGTECHPHHLQENLLTDPIEINDGLIRLPHTPGLSIEMDRVKLEKYQLSY